jgi:hypothetical protein
MPRWGIVGISFGMAALLLGAASGIAWLWLGGGALAGITALALGALALKPRDRYSLDDLREVHERSSWGEADELDIDPDADIVCANCGTVYGAIYPICPSCRCGRTGCR